MLKLKDYRKRDYLIIFSVLFLYQMTRFEVEIKPVHVIVVSLVTIVVSLVLGTITNKMIKSKKDSQYID